MSKQQSCSRLSQAAAAASMLCCCTQLQNNIPASVMYSATRHGCSPWSLAEAAAATGFEIMLKLETK